MNWLYKLIWRFKSDKQILIAKDDALFWLKVYSGKVISIQDNARDRWDNFIEPELKRRGL